MPEDGAPRLIRLCHIGIQSDDPATLAELYKHVLGMKAMGGSGEESPFSSSAFLSSHPIDLTLSEEALLKVVADLAAREGISWSPSPGAAAER